MVSTDDPEIAEYSLSLGAKVPGLRSEINSSDTATTMDVLREVVGFYHAQNKAFKSFCCIYPTAPFVTNSLLSQAFEKFEAGDFDFLIPVSRFSYPVQRSLRIDGQMVSMVSPENQLVRSQDLERRYHDVGQFYIGKPSSLELQSFFSGKSTFVEVDERSSQDIDDMIDWEIAELKFKNSNPRLKDEK